MLEDLDLNIRDMEENIYVQLLGEGTVVYRPVPAMKIKENLYKIQGKEIYDPDDEEWEFLPESVVVVQRQELEGGQVFVAIKKQTEY